MASTAVPSTAPGLREQLDRWVGEGLLSEDQAARIERAEGVRAGAPPDGAARSAVPAAAVPAAGEPVTAQEPAPAGVPPRTVPIAVEALGYLGALLALVAGVLAARRLWPGIPTWAEIAFAAGAGGALLLFGFAVRAGSDPVLGRLKAALWVLSTGCAAGVASLLVIDVWSVEGLAAGLSVASVVTAYAVPLWVLSRSPVQQAAVFAGLAVVAGTGVGVLDEDLLPTSAGVAVWALSGLWALAASRGLVRPRLTGHVVASLGLLVGALMTMQTAAGVVLALGTAGALLVGGVASGRVWLLLLGAYGVLQVVPEAASRYLPGSVGAPVALLAVGLILLGAAVRLIRTRSPDGMRGSSPGPRSR